MRLIHGEALDVLQTLPDASVDAVITDPPYGMRWNTDSTRFSGGQSAKIVRNRPGLRRGEGRDDWGAVRGDSEPFDPAPWLRFPKVILWGANHYAQRLPVGTTLVWVKKAEHLYGTFLSDAEIGWMKGGHGAYCLSHHFPPVTRIREGGGVALHPTQKPIGLMRWCIEKLKLEPGSTILDPYMGCGTTGIAAAMCGHKFIGVEQDPHYFAVAQRRIAEAEACRDGRGVGELFDFAQSTQ